MTTSTPTLGLVTYNLTTDGSALFQTFRDDIAGTTVSNMTKLDDFAAAASGSIADLEGQNSVISVNGLYSTLNNYVATGVTGITAYDAGLVIALTLDVGITGTTTLNINSLGIKTLTKIGHSGSSANLVEGDIVENSQYIFIYDGVDWVMVNSNPVTHASRHTWGGQDFLLTSGSLYSGVTPIQVSGSQLMHTVSGITAGSALKTYVNTYGHVTSACPLVAADLGTGSVGSGSKVLGDNLTWISTGSLLSGVTPIQLSGSQITHVTSGITAGSSLKNYVNSYGHVTSSCALVAADLGSGAVGSGDKVLLDNLTWFSSGSLFSGTDPIHLSGSQIQHATSGISSGSYNVVQVDTYGHITSASVAETGAGNSVVIAVVQGAHGFENGQAVYFSGSTCALAKSDSLSTIGTHVVGDKTDDAFNAYQSGVLEITSHGLGESGSWLFVSSTESGSLVTTEGTYSNPLAQIIDANTLHVHDFRASGAQTLGIISFQIDQTGGTSDTYGVLAGNVDDSNTVYTVSLGSYISGGLSVYLNGQLQTQGSSEDWVETAPASGTFTFATAPATGDEITAIYQFTANSTGNADTLDGLHASYFTNLTDTITQENMLYNGAFNVAQRGTSFTSATSPANSDDTYLLDRWILLSDGNDIVDVTQEGTVVPTGARYSIKLDVETANKQFGILQILEGKDSSTIIGGQASLSFDARMATAGDTTHSLKAVVLSWDGTEDAVTSDVVSSWAASPTFAANWTAENTAASNTLTTSWQTFTIEDIAIDTANAKNVAVFIFCDQTDGTVTNAVYISKVKLEYGANATPFVARPYAEELALCQRYYWRDTATTAYHGFAVGVVESATRSSGMYAKLPVTMMTTPTCNYSNCRLFDGSTGTAVTSIGTSWSSPDIFGNAFDATGGGLTTGRACMLQANNNVAAYIEASAEL